MDIQANTIIARFDTNNQRAANVISIALAMVPIMDSVMPSK